MTSVTAAHAHSKCLPHAHAKPQFPGVVTSAGYAQGGGVQFGPKPKYQGFYVDVRMDPLAKTKATATLDSAKRTITITVKVKPGTPNRIAYLPRQIKAGTPRGMHMGTLYKLIVKDGAGDVLKTGTARPSPGK